MRPSELTIPEKILVATFEKWPDKDHIFTEAEITIAAWEKYPETFGLRGYAKLHPDSRRVLSNIMGEKGLRGKRWITSLGDTRYSLTQSGLDYASSINTDKLSVDEIANNSLPNNHLRILRRLLDSEAYEFWANDQDDECILRDAMTFWSITPGSTREDFDDRVKSMEDALTAARILVRDKRILDVGSKTKQTVTERDIDDLGALNKRLQEKFQDDLSYIKNRVKKHGIKRVIR